MYDPTADYVLHKDEYDEAIQSVLLKGNFIGGDEVQKLEIELQNRLNRKYCITCGNGTDALQIALMAVGVGKGDEVITTPLTWISTSEVISLVGAIPIFVDVDPVTFNIDPTLIEKKITSKTKAIIPVNLYGQCADYQLINKIAEKHNLVVIEDACQSFGAEQNGVKSGCLAKISCTSFFPSKPLGCYGDGGAIFTDDHTLFQEMSAIKNHGQIRRFEHVRIGMNSRLDTIQAAILLVKLKYFDEAIEKRRMIASYYTNAFSKLKYVCTPAIKENKSAWAQYTILLENETVRNRFYEELPVSNIFYRTPIYKQPMYSHLNCGDLPIVEDLCGRIINIPIYPECDYEEIVRSFVTIYDKIYAG